jgi:hypothetical protein
VESEKRSFLLVALMLVALACAPAQPSQARPASERTDRYILPLIGNYAIARRDLETSRNDSDLFTLVELTPNPSGIPHRWGNIVDSVKSVAVQKPLIIGEVNDGFFIFDTSAQNPQPASYKTLEALRSDLLKRVFLTRSRSSILKSWPPRFPTAYCGPGNIKSCAGCSAKAMQTLAAF